MNDAFIWFDIADIGNTYVEKVAKRIADKGFEVENCFKERVRNGGAIGRSSSFVEHRTLYTIEFSNDAGEFGTVLCIHSEFSFDKRNPYDGRAIEAARKSWGGYSCQATDETKALLGWKQGD